MTRLCMAGIHLCPERSQHKVPLGLERMDQLRGSLSFSSGGSRLLPQLCLSRCRVFAQQQQLLRSASIPIGFL